MSYCVYNRRFAAQPHKDLITDTVSEYDDFTAAQEAAAAAWKQLPAAEKKLTHIFVGESGDAKIDPIEIEKLGLRKARQWYGGAGHRVSFKDFDSDYELPRQLTKKEVKAIQKAAYEAYLQTEDGWRFAQGYYGEPHALTYCLVVDGQKIACYAGPLKSFHSNRRKALGISDDARITELFRVDKTTKTMHIIGFKEWA